MQAELLGAGLEQHRRLIHLQRRQRIFAAARALEDIAAVDLGAFEIAGFAGDAKLILGLIEERFELGIAHRPVGQRRIGGNGVFAVALDGLGADAEIVLVHAP